MNRLRWMLVSLCLGLAQRICPVPGYVAMMIRTSLFTDAYTQPTPIEKQNIH